MQPDSERDLIAAWQDGNLSAARQIVTMLQSEAIYVSYLLTGDRDEAVALAETGFLNLFNQSRSGDPDIDQRLLALNLLGQAFLRGEYRERVRPDSGGILLEPAPARFQVDDRRTLLLAALGRLEARERAILILRDFSGLETHEITRLQERRGEPLVAPMETARQRVRQSMDIPAGDPLRPTFVEATFNAPRTDLWSRLEEEISAIQQRGRNQSRLISAAIIAVIVVVLAGGTLALLGGTEGETDDSSAGSPATQEPTSLPAGPTVGQSIDREPAATPTTAYPRASVPSWLIMETTLQPEPGQSSRSITVFDPGTGQTRRLPSNSPLRIAAGADEVHFSPDGYQMVFFREEAGEGRMDYFLTSYSTDSIARQWETAILSLDREDDSALSLVSSSSHIPVRLTSAVTGNRVYAALLTTGTEPRLEIHSFFSRNGMPRGSVEIELPEQNVDTRVFRGNILLHAPPGSDKLYLLVESFGDSVSEWRAALMTFERSDLSLVSERSISADPSQGYWLWSSQMTADGTALYGVHENRSGNEVRAQFLELETGELTSLSLPFDTSANRLESVLTVPSHDGGRIFVLDRDGQNVAVVNLSERSIERVFPLDRDSFEGDIEVRPDDRLFGYGSALSADGSQLFIASWNHGTGMDSRGRDGIWVVDTSAWSLAGFVPLDGLVSGIFLSPAENAVHAQVWTSPYSSPDQHLVKIVTDSRPSVVGRVDVPHDDAHFTLGSPWHHYMSQFGRSPAIDHVQPVDVAGYSTLPRIEVSTSPDAISAGQNATVEVRFINPSTGEPLDGEQPDVRFDPGVNLTATLHSDGQQPQIAVLGETRPGVYRGTATLPETGVWDIDISMTAGDGTSVDREGVAQVGVSPSFSGSDGRSYAFRISTMPQRPLTNHEVALQLELVDIASGDPVPGDVTVEIDLGGEVLSELPRRVDVTLLHPEPGYLTARMEHTGDGVYHGSVRFWVSGTWSPSLTLQMEGAPQVSIPLNSIVVGSP